MCFRSRIGQIASDVCCEFHDSSKNGRNIHTTKDGRGRGRSCGAMAHYNILSTLLLLPVLLTFLQQTSPAAFVHAANGFSASKGLGTRTRTPKIDSTHEATGLSGGNVSLAPNAARTGKYEIHGVAGEPNYKSVNLTWEVEFVPSPSPSAHTAPDATDVDAVTNSSAEVEPPKAFQIFFCELQSFGPHRCRSKLVNESQQVEPNVPNSSNTNYNDNNNNDVEGQVVSVITEKFNRQLRRYAVQIDNLRMATKYSFHIRPQVKRRNMKITGRSELFGNEIDDELKGVPVGDGQTIIIPTKGFSAQATKCLPHASEIEVETGPYFGGKIVVDGGNCGVKGDPDDAVDRYTMRIDHKMCGSLVKPETNTVETFITVQENLGIYTHSTRRFVVVCSFQSGMQTVRASFTVPGSDGVAAAVENDPFEPDDRLGRELRQMRYVDKSALVLKEHATSSLPGNASEESEAYVQEVTEPAPTEAAHKNNGSVVAPDDAPNSVAVLEDIVPGENEAHIKHENEVLKPALNGDDKRRHPMEALLPVAHARLAKFAKLVSEQQAASVAGEEAELEAGATAEEIAQQWYGLRNNNKDTGIPSTLQYITANSGSVLLTISLSVIILGVFIMIVYREARRQRFIRNNLKMQQLQSSSGASSSASSCVSISPTASSSLVPKLHAKRTMPRSLQPQHPQGSL